MRNGKLYGRVFRWSETTGTPSRPGLVCKV